MKIRNKSKGKSQERLQPKSKPRECDSEDDTYFLTLASEKSLAKDWLRPEEDEAWKSLQ